MNELFCARCGIAIQGHAVQGPGGWMHAACAPAPPPAPASKSPVPLLVALGCAVPVALVLLLAVFLAIWQFLSPAAPGSPGGVAGLTGAAGVDAGAAEPLTERYGSGNGMLTASYPASFAASQQGDGAVIVTRALPDGNAETLVLEAVEQPISTDIDELERILNVAEVKMFDGYAVVSKRRGTCLGRPGLEVLGTFTLKNGTAYDRRACRFYDHAHYYSLAYALPRASAADQTALLQRILDATVVNR
jgi:hypothetical protein